MTSILTNTSAMSSLQALATTQRQLSKTEAQVSSGLAIGSASDNAAYWSIATTMRADASALGAVQTSLSLTSSIFATADTGLTQIQSELSKIDDDLVVAHQSGVDRKTVQDDISARQQAIANDALNTSFNGVNLLADNFHEISTGTGSTSISDQYGNAGTAVGSTFTTTSSNLDLAFKVPSGPGEASLELHGFNIVSSTSWTDLSSSAKASTPQAETAGRNYGNDDDLGILTGNYISTVDPVSFVKLGNPASVRQLTSVLSFVIDGSVSPAVSGGYAPVVASDQDLDDIQHGVESAMTELTAVGAQLGAEETSVTNLQAFNSSLSDAINSGIGSLVDADMNVASTRLQALQTQQQLGIQALSIANQNSQLLLKLFQAA